ncbi:hypothetical protein FisN_10Lu428 [Fistulifera solaris]|uniref:Uncharacterized protein n=1 Tax=Fistulifera solaris TaxID=1519565 RepID=A0A1Z5JUL5_FISSO|nr:hypothetical protein FisN_10Lu428 [Fistulifera solaris]|eukprot:GAX17710.1 hypothetical protein FisN_10Lu428 [Fistulifera solaris]
MQKRLRAELLTEPVDLYTILREPDHLSEIYEGQNDFLSILCDNETIICLKRGLALYLTPKKRCISFHIYNGDTLLYDAIYGKEDAAVAETATWLWSLKVPKDVKTALHVNSVAVYSGMEESREFDFAAIGPEQLIRILESNPTRMLQLQVATWTSEQARILATRPFPLKLTINYEHMYMSEEDKDDGTIFIDALEQRQSTFGSLLLDVDTLHSNGFFSISSINLDRLAKLTIFDKLAVAYPRQESVLVPFAAKAHELDYKINAQYVEPSDFESLEIVTTKLDLTFFERDMDIMG